MLLCFKTPRLILKLANVLFTPGKTARKYVNDLLFSTLDTSKYDGTAFKPGQLSLPCKYRSLPYNPDLGDFIYVQYVD